MKSTITWDISQIELIYPAVDFAANRLIHGFGQILDFRAILSGSARFMLPTVHNLVY